MRPQDRKQPQRLTGNGSVEATGTTQRDNSRDRISRHPVPPLNGSLPRGYGETRIVLLPVDPYVVHAYWEISAGEMGYVDVLVEEGVLRPQALLRFHDVTSLSVGGVRAAGSFDVEIDIESRNWYVRLLSPERAYVVDLGFRQKDSRFHRIARSNRVETPRAWPCAETGQQRMRVVEVDGVTTVAPVNETVTAREGTVASEESEDRPGIRTRVPREGLRAVIGLADETRVMAPEAHKVRETMPVRRSIESPAKQDQKETRTESGVRKAEAFRPVEGPGGSPHERPPPRSGGRQETAEIDLSLLCERLYVSGLPSSRMAAEDERDGPNDQ